MRIHLSSLLCLFLALVAANATSAPAQNIDLFPSATAYATWQASGNLTTTVTQDPPALRVTALKDGQIIADVPQNHWHRYGTLSLKLDSSATPDQPIQLKLFYTDQATERHPLHTTTLTTGTATVKVPLIPATPYALHYVRQLGLELKTTSADHYLQLSHIQLSDPPPNHSFPGQDSYPHLVGKAIQGQPVELRFTFGPALDTPFTPDQEVSARIYGPDGTQTLRPGFFTRDYQIVKVDGKEELRATGAPYWAIRFTPTQQGTHNVHVRAGGRLFGKPTQVHVKPGHHRGFMRISKLDNKCLEFQDGTLFYPIGMNFCWPWDGMYGEAPKESFPTGKELTVYDDFFGKLSAAGGNCSQIWMTPFWTTIEWSSLHSGYGGLGWYNLEAAWKLDYILERARAHDIQIILSLLNHHQFFKHKSDRSKWPGNPYNTANGGPLQERTQFMGSEEARQHYANMLRYILARWGHDPTIMTLNLATELDNLSKGENDDSPFVWKNKELLKTPTEETKTAEAWMKQMNTVIANVDPHRPLVTAGNCQEGRVIAQQIYALPQMPIVMTDSYTHGAWTPSENVHSVIHREWYDLKNHGKPAMLTEMGYHNSGDTPEEAAVGLHCTVWTSSMFPFCGGALYWWWNVVDHADLYAKFTPVAKFWKGEERRGQHFYHSCLGGSSITTDGFRERFWSYGNVGKTKTYGILFPRAEARYFIDSPSVIRNSRWRLTTSYQTEFVDIEWWDTHTGEIIGRRRFPVTKKRARVIAPDFTQDIAFKFWPVEATDREDPIAYRALPDPPPPTTTLTVTTYPLADHKVPHDQKSARELILATKTIQGTGAWKRLDVRMNPYGDNQNFYAVYDGQLTCKTPGTYTFALNSDDASFLWINDKLVAEWPKEHGPDKNKYGLKNVFDHQGQVELGAGTHTFRALHVNSKGAALFRVGWQPPETDEIVLIPPDVFHKQH